MRISKEVAGAYVNVLSCISRGEPEKKVRETSACINGSSTEILTMNIPTTNRKVLTLNQSARYIGQKPSEVNKHG
jgi:hypothetical protein